MALDSLFIAYTKNAQIAHAAEIRAAINDLFAQLENPSAYNPNDFARADAQSERTRSIKLRPADLP